MVKKKRNKTKTAKKNNRLEKIETITKKTINNEI